MIEQCGILKRIYATDQPTSFRLILWYTKFQHKPQSLSIKFGDATRGLAKAEEAKSLHPPQNSINFLAPTPTSLGERRARRSDTPNPAH